MMKWKVEGQALQSTPPAVVNHRKVQLHVDQDVDQDSDGTRWCYLSMSFGQYMPGSLEDVKRNWPREAIDKARQQLDALEQSLNEQPEG